MVCWHSVYIGVTQSPLLASTDVSLETEVESIVNGNHIEKHSIEVHNCRRPLDRLTLTLTLTFDLLFIGGRGIVMDYLSVCQVCQF